MECYNCIVSSYINCLLSLLTTIHTKGLFLLICDLQIVTPLAAKRNIRAVYLQKVHTENEILHWSNI